MDVIHSTGGERILEVLEDRLAARIRRLDFSAELNPANVRHCCFFPVVAGDILGERKTCRLRQCDSLV